MKHKTKLTTYELEGRTVVKSDSIKQLYKDDLLYLLSNPDEEMLASDYLKEMITLWEDYIDRVEKSRE